MVAILEVNNLVKKYGENTAVKGISFSIKEREIFSLFMAGENIHVKIHLIIISYP